MNPEWQQWTRENVARGCDPVQLCEILRQHGFPDADIREALADRYPPPHSPVDAIDYRALANPALVQNPDAVGATALADARLQLYTIPHFLDAATCEQIMAVMAEQLRPSTVTTGTLHYGYRTSRTCDLGEMRASVVALVDRRIAETLGINAAWSESTQGQKYEVGQEFKAHTDYFQPATPEYARYAGARGQRSWTFMIYLNTTQAGGATRFTRIDQSFQPQQGTAVVWNNLTADGSPNIMTEHHGMPVTQGDKSIITKWFRDRGVAPLSSDNRSD